MLALYLTAELEGITDLRPKDTAEEPFYYTFKVQCTSCRETHPNWVAVSRFETHEMSGSRGEANFVWRCKSCKREHNATVRAPPSAYILSSPPTRQKIIEFDCRGLEFTAFRCEGEFLARGVESGTKFTAMDLGEGEWFEYDEKAGAEVCVRECRWEVARG